MSVTSPPAASSATSFADLGVPAAMVRSLESSGITEAFPIQAATLPDSLAGRDVLGRGRTGSGKTVAFSIPLVARLAAQGAKSRSRRPRGLVLVPTRELAAQVADTLVPLAQSMRLRVATVVGGVSQGPQTRALRSGVDIVVATPGRLEDLIGQGECDLGAVGIAVLDEADHMADLGFLPSVKRLLDATDASGQRLLFSATLDRGVDVLVRRYLNSPVVHEVDSADSPVPAMTHHVLRVQSGDKAAVVRQLASGTGRSLLFTRTKYGAKKLAAQLSRQGIPAVELHGNLSQAARSRNLEEFSSGRVRVLVATDIAARGIHVDDVGLVVHVDPPAEHKAYLHRSGRTARAGAEGVVVTVMIPNQRRDVQSLTKAAGIRPVTTEVGPGDALLAELVGPAAEPSSYVPPSGPPQRKGAGGGGPRRGSSSPRGKGAGHSRNKARGGASGGPGGNRRTDRSERSGRPERSGSGERSRNDGRADSDDGTRGVERRGGFTSSDRSDRSGRPEGSGRPGRQGRPAGSGRDGSPRRHSDTPRRKRRASDETRPSRGPGGAPSGRGPAKGPGKPKRKPARHTGPASGSQRRNGPRHSGPGGTRA